MSQENFLQQNFAARIGGSNFGKDTTPPRRTPASS